MGVEQGLLALIGAADVGAYEIEQSVKFDDDRGAYLSRTPSSAGNQKTWTFSCWVKLGSLSQGERGTIFQSAGGPTIYQDSGLRFAHAWDPAGTDYIRETVAVFRDPSAWYHVVWWCDTTQSGTRWKIYVNGVEQTLQTPSGNNGEPAQNTDLGINSTNQHTIGKFAGSSYLDGYLAEVNFIDGSALDPTDFGEFDNNGVWRPIRYAGSYTGNSFYLKFEQGALGTDSSGLGNNWTTNELWEEIGTPDYAANWIGSTSGSFYSGSWENVFNGDVTVGSNYIYAYNNTATLTFSTPLSGVIEVFGSDGGVGDTNSGFIRLSDNSTWSINSVARANAQWHSFGSKTNITSITVSSPGGHGAILGAIRVDGNLLANISAKANYVNMADTPTTNWCTLNPIQGGNVSTFSNGNLATVCNNASTSGGTIAVNSGKWYAEFVCTAKTATNAIAGICTVDGFDADRQPNESLLGGSGTVYVMNGTYIQSGSAVSYGATWAVNDVIGVALDLDSTQNTVTFYKNGTSQGAINIDNAAYVIAVGNGQASSTVTYIVNFGQRDFEYTPPTGFNALNTSNLPAPTVKDGSKYFDTVLYAGSLATAATVGETQSVTGLNTSLTPDMVWIKNRGSGRHVIFDVERLDADGDNALRVDSQDQANPNVRGGVSALNAGGFTAIAGSDGSDNTGVTCQTGNNYVAWAWAEGATQGMDVLTGTGGTAVNHNLGVAPDFVIFKYTNATSDWNVYHKDVTSTSQRMILNSGATVGSIATSWTINATNFAYGGGSNNWAAYLFSEVEGYSKFGIYERNGSSDGPYIHLGFTPALILIKEYAAGTENWTLFDNKRLGYNPNDTPVWPNSSQSETYIQSTYANEIDFLSNGFKIRTSDSMYNSSLSSYRYLYAAWAVNPFGGSGVSPATAR